MDMDRMDQAFAKWRKAHPPVETMDKEALAAERESLEHSVRVYGALPGSGSVPTSAAADGRGIKEIQDRLAAVRARLEALGETK